MPTSTNGRGQAPLVHPWTFTGSVSSFDADAGLGSVAVDDGRSWQFHCTSIADGTRQIATGTELSFVVAAGGPGTWEAYDVRPIF